MSVACELRMQDTTHHLYSKSCTVLINGKQVCIHDETWKECEVSRSNFLVMVCTQCEVTERPCTRGLRSADQ